MAAMSQTSADAATTRDAAHSATGAQNLPARVVLVQGDRAILSLPEDHQEAVSAAELSAQLSVPVRALPGMRVIAAVYDGELRGFTAA